MTVQEPAHEPGRDYGPGPSGALRRVGAIDCGTNSIRLLIADAGTAGSGAPQLHDVLRLMRIVRLGQGVDAAGRLSDAALDRTFTAVEVYAGLLAERGVELDAGSLRMVATSATRDAGNRQVFVDGIQQRLGIVPEVITGAEEAELSFTGASIVRPGAGTGDGSAVEDGALEQRRTLVIDLGGGSTEFVVGDATGVLASRSMDIGCVRLTERHLHSDPPTPAEIAAAVGDVDAAIDEVLRTVPLGSVQSLVGVAGTVTTVTAHALRLKEYDPDAIDGAGLSTQQIAAAAGELLAMSRRQRAELPYMHPGRADVIGSGALIWRRIVERVTELTDGRVQSATSSEHDILDGIALSVARS